MISCKWYHKKHHSIHLAWILVGAAKGFYCEMCSERNVLGKRSIHVKLVTVSRAACTILWHPPLVQRPQPLTAPVLPTRCCPDSSSFRAAACLAPFGAPLYHSQASTSRRPCAPISWLCWGQEIRAFNVWVVLSLSWFISKSLAHANEQRKFSKRVENRR